MAEEVELERIEALEPVAVSQGLHSGLVQLSYRHSWEALQTFAEQHRQKRLWQVLRIYWHCGLPASLTLGRCPDNALVAEAETQLS